MPANRGAVAMISSSRLAYSNYNADFNYALYENLFADYAKTGADPTPGRCGAVGQTIVQQHEQQ